MDARPPVNGRLIDPDVEAELNKLGAMPIAILRVRYRELFRSEPPPAFGPDLLRRSIAQRVQERAYGGLSREAKKLLGQLVRSMASRKTGRLEVPQRIKPGSELVRVWNDQTHRVTVLTKGFAYQGEVFTSLSEIANKITGTRWNGPKFFGLRTKNKETDGTGQARPASKGVRRGRK
ncbi:DUF2924 domain-containing protein [Afipia clevelandensis]|uniref:DUF2924 domain-containing protein n=1 Tax=Afipia clevelandensis ATCC 49720 TaxID=883079 RepID=K8NN97_9BRAD|nr:DUF2924 domain-containing protein [Afipia clevelandensis]EKS31797.1 hypothetical protein HMPREF9696_04018 [Afipia clevelandensis ATCC 49720]